ncbi:MAG: EthD family reductase [Candidatus Acidiferrum sp.]
MAGAKIVVLYPQPKDVAAFEKAYLEEHVPMAVEKLTGKTRLVASKTLSSAMGSAPFYRIAEIHFPSLEALQACLASPGGQQTAAHAVSISTGGAPIFMIAEEESYSFAQQAGA